jgi:hypothetical protein
MPAIAKSPKVFLDGREIEGVEGISFSDLLDSQVDLGLAKIANSFQELTVEINATVTEIQFLNTYLTKDLNLQEWERMQRLSERCAKRGIIYPAERKEYI